MTRVIVTKMFVNIAHMQVCVVEGATDKEILEVCNRENLSGTTHGWAKVWHENDEFWGNVAPVQCADNKDRIHYMVAC